MASKNKKTRSPLKASFSEFQWEYCIIFLVECDQVSNSFISTLNETEISDQRIRMIKKQEILNDLKQKSKPTTPISTQNSRAKSPKKTVKGELLPPRDEQLEQDENTILHLLKSNKDQYLNLPPNSLANIIKQFMNKLKVRLLENYNSSSSKKDVKAAEKMLKKDKKGGSKKTASSQKNNQSKGEKQKIVLDKQEEPQLPTCLIFVGFYEPLLPVEMAKLGLPIRAIVALKKRSVSSFESNQSLEIETKNLNRQLTSKKFNFDFFKFWSYAGDKEMPMLKSKDIADIDLELPEPIAVVLENPKHRGKAMSANMKKDLKLNINRFLSNLSTHILYALDVYNRYLSNIETYDMEAKYKPLSEAKHYLHLSSLLPYECSDVSFVLNNMVEQVSVWHNEKKIENTFEENTRQRIQSLPKIINHNNTIDSETFHLCTKYMKYDIHCVLQDYLATNPVFNSWKLKDNRVSKKQSELNKFHLKRLHKLGGDLDRYLFDLYLHWYILCRMKMEKNKLKVKRVKKEKYVSLCSYLSRARLFRDSIRMRKGTKHVVFKQVEKWRRFSSMSVEHVNALRKENLKIFKKFIEIPDIVELVQKDETVEKLISNKDDSLFKYAESLSPICLLQTVHKLSLNFQMCDKLLFKPSNKILVWFHNDPGISSRKDMLKLESFLGFRDFYRNTMMEESMCVSNLSEKVCDYYTDNEENGDSCSVEGNRSGLSKNLSQTCESPKIKVCDLWGSQMELVTSNQSFISADSSSVVLEIDHWLNLSKTMKIKIKKQNTELVYHKNMQQAHNEERDTSIYSDAVVNFPNGTRVCVDIEEKYLPERFLKLFYNFSIVLPSGLSIQVVKTKSDYYVKQKYVFHSKLTESIENEKYRCYSKAGHVIVFYKSGRIRIMYSNGKIVDCNEIVDNFQQTNENGTNYSKESEENKRNTVEKEKNAKKKDIKKEQKLEKENVDKKQKLKKKSEDKEQTEKKKDVNDEKIQTTLKKSSKNESNDKRLTQELEMFKSENKNSFTVSKQTVTTEYGERSMFDNGTVKPRKPFSLRSIFQPYQTLYIDRSDGYKALYTADGSLLSTFSDGTKIATTPDNVLNISEPCKDLDLNSSLIGIYCRESVECNSRAFLDEDFVDDDNDDCFTIFNLMTLSEHPLYARVEYNVKQCAIRITLPGGIIIYVLENLNDFIIDVDSVTTVIFSKENIVFSCGLLRSSGKENITVINSVSKTVGLSEKSQKPPMFCKTIDSFGKAFLIHKDGDVQLIASPSSDDSLELVTNNSEYLARDFYFYKKVPRSEFERYFVVNPDFSGHEFVHKDDVDLILSDNKTKNKDVIVNSNPTCGQLKSKTLQYPLFENYFQQFITPYTNLESHYFPDDFRRCPLSKPWSLQDSLWLFKKDTISRKLKRAKVSKSQTDFDNEPVAIVYRNFNEICGENDNKLRKIANIILRYEEKNNQLFREYSRKRYTRRELLDKLVDDLNVNEEI